MKILTKIDINNQKVIKSVSVVYVSRCLCL